MIKKLLNLAKQSENQSDQAPNKVEMLITGHSHSFCMGVNPSGELRLEKINVATPDVYGVMGAWDGSRSEKYWHFVADNCHKRFVVISWAGNQHNSGFIFSREENFDFVLNSNDTHSLQGSKRLIPRTVIEKHFEPSLGGLNNAIEIIKRGKPAGIVIVQTPRPKGDGNFILPFIKSSEHFMTLAKKSGIDTESLQISTLAFRLKLWKLIQTQISQITSHQDVSIIHVPNELTDNDGGLKKEYWSNDVTHANNKYGQAVLEHIHKTLSALIGEESVKSL